MDSIVRSYCVGVDSALFKILSITVGPTFLGMVSSCSWEYLFSDLFQYTWNYSFLSIHMLWRYPEVPYSLKNYVWYLFMFVKATLWVTTISLSSTSVSIEHETSLLFVWDRKWKIWCKMLKLHHLCELSIICKKHF